MAHHKLLFVTVLALALAALTLAMPVKVDKLPLHGSSWKGETPSFAGGTDSDMSKLMKSPADATPTPWWKALPSEPRCLKCPGRPRKFRLGQLQPHYYVPQNAL